MLQNVETFPLVAVGSTATVVMLLLYHVVYIVSSLAVSIITRRKDERGRELEAFARRGLVGRSLGFLTLLFTSVARLAIALTNTCLSVLYYLLPIIMLSAALALLQFRWFDTLHALDTIIKGNMPLLRTLLISPFAIIAQGGLYIAPLYNLTVYAIIHVPINFILWMFSGASSVQFAGGFAGLLLACRDAAVAFATFLEANPSDCTPALAAALSNCTSTVDGRGTVCSGQTSPAFAFAAYTCLDPGLRSIQLSTTSNTAREALTSLTIALGSSDETFGRVLNMIMYPITDLNTWKALEGLVDAIVSAIVGVPTATVARCGLAYEQNTADLRLSMCTPDMYPPFSALVAACRSAGAALNGWFNMLYILIVHGDQTPCPASMDVSAVFDDALWDRMAGSNQTVLVKLSDTAFARTDGANIEYVSMTTQVARTYVSGGWPSPVTPSFGIAAVRLPRGSVDTKGLMGCACVDSEVGMTLNCTIVSQSGKGAWTSPVAWEVITSPQYLSCERVRVVVQSIRWPTQRVSAPLRGFSGSCIADGSCLAADAAVYVIPVCGGSDNNILACFPERAFAFSNCFPYCMGLHLVSDGAAQPLLMRGSASWSSGVLLAQRSCISSSVQPGSDATTTSTHCQMSSPVASSVASMASNCPYAYSCSTWVVDRSVASALYSPSPAIPSFGVVANRSNASALYLSLPQPIVQSSIPQPLGGGVYVAISGQPLVIAGGVTMRMRMQQKPGGSNIEYSIDFPQLVGNQYNEFTMDVGLVDGIPCTPPAAVQSMSASAERPGRLTVPPLNIDRVQWYNPATLSLGGVMWYAVNPNFLNSESFWKWCVTHDATQQVIITSEYAPIRLWRVQTNVDAYCTSLPDGSSDCQSDIAVGFALNDARSPPIQNGMFLATTCLGTYDLWVESLEVFDDLNIAVSVRRGGAGAVVSRYFGIDSAQQGKTVTYFVNTQNVSKVREGRPWVVDDVYPKALLGSTVLCPALRMIPPVGTFIGESLASVLLLFRTPIQIVCNPFAVTEVLAARGFACPDNTLNHGALRDCGEGLFSLDDFFDSVKIASGAFWDVWAFLAYLISEAGVPPTLAAIASGGVEYMGAAHMVSLMPVVHVVDSWGANSGLQRFMSSRRLLAASEEEGGGGEGGEEGGGGGWGAMFAKIFSTAADFVGGITNIASMQVSRGADMGILLSTTDPTHMLGRWCVAPTMAWSHFVYDTGVTIALDVASTIYQGGSVGWWTFANGFYNGRTSFRALVIPSTQTQCEALRLILGGGTGLAQGVYYNCLSGIDLGDAMYALAQVLAVEIPLFRCACMQSSGEDFMSAQASCRMQVPIGLRGRYEEAIQRYAENAQDASSSSVEMCRWYGGTIENSTLRIFDQWFKHSELAANAIGSFLQDVLVPSDGVEQCLAGRTNNPFAVVLMPTPSDHFHVCGTTSACRLRCSVELAAFQAEVDYVTGTGLPVHAVPTLYDTFVESPMFSSFTGPESASAARGFVAAITHPSMIDRPQLCTTCGALEECVVVAVTPWGFQPAVSWNSVFIVAYCVPPPEQLTGYIHIAHTPAVPIGCPSYVCSDVGGAAKLTFMDFAKQPSGSIYLLMGFSSVGSQVIRQGTTSIVTSHMLYVVPAHDPTPGAPFLHTMTLRSQVLTHSISKYMFGSPTPPTGTTVADCSIDAIVDVATNQTGTITVFVSISFTVTYPDGAPPPPDTKPGLAHAIAVWCDPSLSVSSCKPSITFYPPCVAFTDPSLSSVDMAAIDARSEPTCLLGLSLALHLGRTGVLINSVGTFQYVHVPSSDSTDPSGSLPPLYNWYIKPDGSNSTPLLYTRCVVATLTTSQSLMLGRWTYANAFSTALSGLRIVRSSMGNTTYGDWRWFVSNQRSAGTIDWLNEFRAIRTKKSKCSLTMQGSLAVQKRVQLSTNCTPLSCGGCADAQVRVLCAQVQSCIIARCVGSPAELNNVLCGVGGLVSSSYHQMTASWMALYSLAMQMLMLVSRGGLSGEASIAQTLTFAFPTDQFYDLVCTYKDVVAGFVGMCMSLINSLASWEKQGYLTLSITSQLTGAQAESMAHLRAIGNLIYNAIVSFATLPILSMHRWLLCTLGGDVKNVGGSMITVQFGDVKIDPSWGMCSPSGCLSTGLFGVDNEACVSISVQSFADFVTALGSGVGETLLYLLLLAWNSAIDTALSLVWGVQNVMYAFNLQACKVPDYTQSLSLSCSCGDDAYNIPQPHASDSAMWCTGSLDMTLIDGTSALIYNPYSLAEVSAGVAPLLRCLLTTSNSFDACNSDGNSVVGLADLLSQNVHPLAVWTRCKSNYFSKIWDTGAGGLYLLSEPPRVTDLLRHRRNSQPSMDAEVFACLSEPSRLHVDYSACMQLSLGRDLRYGNADVYFQYVPSTGGIPDACIAFGGIARFESGPLRSVAQTCMMDPAAVDPTELTDGGPCPLVAGIWTRDMPHKLPVTVQHGRLMYDRDDPKSDIGYLNLLERISQAFDAFNRTFADQAHHITAMLFSADGDVLHDMMDCMFQGPYTSVHTLPCDLAGTLECPIYWRNDNGSRRFVECDSANLYADQALPFTCGSQLRRSLIKYFYRDFCPTFSGDGLRNALTTLIQNNVARMRSEWTNINNFACMDSATGQCSFSACDIARKFTPCLSMDAFNVSLDAPTNDRDVLSEWLAYAVKYYPFAMQNPRAWTTYYNASAAPGQAAFPAQWKSTPKQATAAINELLYAPTSPVLTFGADEVYSMPYGASLTPDKLLEGSPWSLCMAALAQPWSTMPVDSTSGAIGWKALQNVDWTDATSMKAAVRAVVAGAIERSPLFWHKGRRHAPTPSAICTTSATSTHARVGARIFVGGIDMYLEQVLTSPVTTHIIQPPGGVSFPHRGFSWGVIGTLTCLCSEDNPLGDGCLIDTSLLCPYATSSGASSCEVLRTACANGGVYPKTKQAIGSMFACLHNESAAGMRCPELAPSDAWGLYPVDCGDGPCDVAAGWVGGGRDVVYPGWRLLLEGRGGLWLPNYQHVNATFNSSIHYASATRQASEYAQPFCPPLAGADGGEAARTLEQEENGFNAANDLVSSLFPAMQILTESPVVAACSRFVIETARVQALSYVSARAAAAAVEQSEAWRSKCGAKVRHLALCQSQGMYYDMPPPAGADVLSRSRCMPPAGDPLRFTELMQDGTPMVYVTPWCVAVDRVGRTMYDVRLCSKNIRASATSRFLGTRADLQEGNCALFPQPLDLLADPTYGTLLPVAPAQGPFEVDLTQSLSLARVSSWAQGGTPAVDSQVISNVVDWWPASVTPPVGYHVTSPLAPSDHLAPIVFDSHYAYSPLDRTVTYVHSALRNASLMQSTLGAVGVCRAHSIGMPMFDANTNRICTRSPLGTWGAPHLPVDTHDPLYNVLGTSYGDFPPELLDTHFSPEQCAPDAASVPWSAEGGWAGGIPKLRSLFRVDAAGTITYKSENNGVYPPPEGTIPLNDNMHTGWGTSCDSVAWDASPPCTPDSNGGSGGCPSSTTCLPLQGWNRTSSGSVMGYTGAGTCFSDAASRAIPRRVSCFRSDHCMDGDVCLADGGCSELFFHMWNPQASLNDVEFTVMAESCGLTPEFNTHPYVQSFRGASPWERVPDILHAHGMCSHHDWTSYRNALNQRTPDGTPRWSTPLGITSDDDGSGDFARLRVWNGSSEAWPHIFMDFARSQVVQSERSTMASQNFLKVRAHMCDAPFWHSGFSSSGERLQVCSGYLGNVAGRLGSYSTYPLSLSDDWLQTRPTTDVNSPDVTHWMRTADPEDPSLIHMSAFHHKGVNDVALGFLGAVGRSANQDAVLEAMGDGVGVTFSRCIDHVKCQMPSFTFAGQQRTRIDPLNLAYNFSETSLRRCGSVGSWTGSVCRLDHKLFPLFSYLLWNDAGGDTPRGCSAIWPPAQHLQFVTRVSEPTHTIATILQSSTASVAISAASAAGGVLCASDGCLYTGRASVQLTSAQESDTVAQVITHMNSLATSASSAVLARYTMSGAVATYEDVILCSTSIHEYMGITLYDYAIAYSELSPRLPGLYTAFRLALYEYPVSWLFTSMLTTLFSAIPNDLPDVQPVNTNGMTTGPVDSMLWDEETRDLMCSSGRITYRPALLSLICHRLQVPHAESWSNIDLAQKITEALREHVRQGLADDVLDGTPQSTLLVRCMHSASWVCPDLPAYDPSYHACWRAAWLAHSAAGLSYDTNPCTNAENFFKLGDPRVGSIDSINPSHTWGTYFAQISSALSEGADSAITELDYITVPIDNLASVNANNPPESLPIVHAELPILPQKIIEAGAIMDNGLVQICENTLGGRDLRVDQKRVDNAPADSMCLVPPELQSMDEDRYLKPGAVSAVFINDADSTVVLDVCTETAVSFGSNGGMGLGNSAGARFCYKSTMNLGECSISSVNAPPGVQVRAYTGNSENWDVDSYQCPIQSSFNEINQHMSCTWMPYKLGQREYNTEDGWWPMQREPPYQSDNRWDNVNIDFTDFGTNCNQNSQTGLDFVTGIGCLEWKNAFESMTGVCFLEFRLEQSTTTSGICWNSATLGAPNCPSASAPRPVRAFAVTNETTVNTQSVSAPSLWRCDLCTPLVQPPIINTPIACTYEGFSSAASLTTSAFARTLPFLSQATELATVVASTFPSFKALEGVCASSKVGTDVRLPLVQSGWESPFAFERYNPYAVLQDELSIWNLAVANPQEGSTMICPDAFLPSQQTECDPTMDRRRQALGAFVQSQYRETDGVWMQTVSPGYGVRWRSNSAHSSAGRFTLVYADGGRSDYNGDAREVMTKWLLGKEPCSNVGPLANRICVRSDASKKLYALHPWVGGDFNPFEMLDVCPWSQSSSPMCPCDCQPQWACSLVNHSSPLEFPVSAACSTQATNAIPLFGARDDSDICNMARYLSTRAMPQCTHSQGMLGGIYDTNAYSLDELDNFLHSKAGRSVPQSLLYDEYMLSGDSVLWSGGTSFESNPYMMSGFLKFRRGDLGPANVAFGFGDDKATLVVRALSLLSGGYQNAESTMSPGWVRRLGKQWDRDLQPILQLYPQLSIGRTPRASNDWSCPFRVVSFVGGSNASFAPLSPNPVEAAVLYGRGGVHPLIAPSSAFAYLSTYETTTGACFYPTVDNTRSTVRRPVSGADTSACSLVGVISALSRQVWSLSSVESNFDTRCRDVIDTPDTGAQLRSGEWMPPSRNRQTLCGLLPRVRPFLSRTNGRRGSVRRVRGGLTTSDEGGDCHMGRAFLLPSSGAKFAGSSCMLTRKDASGGTSSCASSGKTVDLQRSTPLDLKSVVDLLPNVAYRGEEVVPEFTSGVQEVSFGQIYAPSLAESLASDLIGECDRQLGCALRGRSGGWRGGSAFLQGYMKGEFAVGVSPVSSPDLLNASITARASAQMQASAAAQAVWGGNWTWSFANKSAAPVSGGFTRLQWASDRARVCKDSLLRYLNSVPQGTAIRNISMCNPPPTASLAMLCAQLVQARGAVARRSCQIFGSCVGNRALFYLPYQWVPTNNEYAGQTVTRFYQSLLTTYTTSTLPASCATPKSALGDLATISRQVAIRCPATIMDSLKTILGFIRSIGEDLLQMAYDCYMMAASMLAMPATLLPPAQPEALASLISLFASYFEHFIGIFLKDLFPLLESMSKMFLCNSSFGQIVALVLQGLCEFYNVVIANTIQGIWCYVLMPAIVNILKFVEGLALLGGQGAASSVAAISNAIGGGNTPKQCADSFSLQTTCDFGCSRETNTSYAEFRPQAMATMCWTGGTGGGLLNGQSSLLTCTASDTCALQPLSADDTASLVYCGSCPSTNDAGTQGVFACDVTLQRCTCGAVPATPQACQSTADCLMPDTVCGISDTISGVSHAFVTPACSTCGTIGQEPLCVVNSVSEGGYCACGNVRSALLTCPVAGARVHIATSTLCLIALSAPLSATLSGGSTLIPTFTPAYAQFAVSTCLIAGGYSDVCVRVQLPLTATTHGGVQTLVALYTTSQHNRAGRRLLGAQSSEVDRKVAMKLALQEAEALQDGSNATAEERQNAKRAIYWRALCALVAETHSLNDVYNCSTQVAPLGYSRLVSRLVVRPAWLWDVLREVPETRPLTVIPQAIYRTFGHHDLHTRGNSTPTETYGRRLLQAQDSTTTTINITSVLNNARASGVVTNNPFYSIIKLAGLTGMYYRQHIYGRPPVVCNETGWMSCNQFRFPPPRLYTGNNTLPAWVRAMDIVLLLPTMGGGGVGLVDALTSNMSYEQSVAGDYITGVRLLRDLSECNHTALTLGPTRQRNILAVTMVSAALLLAFTMFVRPNTLLTMTLWYVFFPMMVMWGAYTLSPLCFPMLPPVLFRDIYIEVQRLLPTFTGVPKTLVHSGCTSSGMRLRDALFDESCYARCTDEPFLMMSWQDTAAWWMCDLSVDLCVGFADWIEVLPVDLMNDFVSSARFYADVVLYAKFDPEYVSGFRLCATLTLYNVGVMLGILSVCAVILPSAMLTIVEISASFVVFLIDVQAANAT